MVVPQVDPLVSKNGGDDLNKRRILATFPGGWNGAGGMVLWFNLSLHRQAADWYVNRYFHQYSVWPIGKHEFTVSYGVGEGFDIKTPIGTNSGQRLISMCFEALDVGGADYEEVISSDSLLSYVVNIDKKGNPP